MSVFPRHTPKSVGGIVAALDVGGTTVKAGLVAPSGFLWQTSRPTAAEQGPQAALGSVVGVIDDLIAALPDGATLGAIGLVAPGIIDETQGVIVSAANLGWEDLPLAAMLTERFGVPVGLSHDVRAAALAEGRDGAGRGHDAFTMIVLGTGIAVGTVIGGVPVVGQGYAGEIGHGGSLSGDPCACGGRGCLETYASASGVARRFARLTGKDSASAEDVERGVVAGDPIALKVWDDAVQGLAGSVSGAVRFLGLPLVIVGGGLSGAGDLLLDPLRAAVKARLTVHRMPQIVPAQLGAKAGLWGAGIVAWRAAALAGRDTTH
jgi:glucokinase